MQGLQLVCHSSFPCKPSRQHNARQLPYCRSRKAPLSGCIASLPANKLEETTVQATPYQQQRRLVIQSILLQPVVWLFGTQAEAADFSDILAKVFPRPPEPVLFPRKALDQRFAVLLMRSTYDAVDALDFMPMDAFQKNFWKLRQSEQEAYNLQYSPLRPRAGDLTDPLYFDFISFSQYATVARELPKGQQVFKEYCEDCPDTQYRIVRRAPDLADNSLLPAAFFRTVGDNIYTGLKDGFRGEVFGAPGPLPPTASVSDLAANIQQILDIMVNRGYALKAQVTDIATEPQPSFTVKLQGPANLWALEALTFRRAVVVNAYDAMVVDAYLRACGRQGSYDLSLTEAGLEAKWTITA